MGLGMVYVKIYLQNPNPIPYSNPKKIGETNQNSIKIYSGTTGALSFSFELIISYLVQIK
jgi:hypothetical protein